MPEYPLMFMILTLARTAWLAATEWKVYLPYGGRLKVMSFLTSKHWPGINALRFLSLDTLRTLRTMPS